MKIQTLRLVLAPLSPDDAPDARAYHLENADHLARWEPERPGGYHSEEAWTARAEQAFAEFDRGQTFSFLARPAGGGPVIGVAVFSAVQRGPFQACSLGYSVAARMQGQGVAMEMLGASIAWVFGTAKLHRVMAAYLPENHRSGALLDRLGFEREGYARDYLQIAGRWRDHILTAKINEACLP